MNSFWSQLGELMGLGQLAEVLISWLPSLLTAIVILLLFWLIWRLVRRGVRFATHRAQLDRTAVSFILTVLKYTLLTIGVVAALGKLGINTTSLLTSLGVAGLTVGFAAKDVLSNMISGLFIFWDRPFVLGDLVEVGGHYGRVDSITMRSTRVVTPDGRMLAVPNTVVVNTTVASYTNFPHIRIDIPFTVAVDESMGRVRDTVLSPCLKNEQLLKNPAPSVVVTALNDYNVAMELQVWLQDEKQHIAARQALTEQTFEVLRQAGVDMPFETLSLTPIEIRKALNPPNGGETRAPVG